MGYRLDVALPPGRPPVFLRLRLERLAGAEEEVMRHVLIGTIALGALAIGVPARAAPPLVEPPTHADVSPRLDQMPVQPQTQAPVAQPPEEREKENLLIPIPKRKKVERSPAQQKLMLQPHNAQPSTALGPPPNLAASVIEAFDGIRQGLNYNPSSGVFPPDTNGSVGADYFVQWVNQAFAVFDKKDGHMVGAPRNGNVLWQGFGGNCEQDNDGDPIVIYDKIADRWLMTQFAIRQPNPSDVHYSQCVAISKTSDPLGSYFRYEYKFQQMNDYPKFGVWRDGYYVSFNMFRSSEGGWAGAKVCALERSKLLIGDPTANIVCFDPKDESGSPVGGVLPADIDGTTLPPEGSPELVVGFGADQLRLWQIAINWAQPGKSTISTPTLLNVDRFDPACNGAADCIPQLGTTQKLQSLTDRLMYRLAYRNYGMREQLLASHTVATPAGSGVRWYELSRNLPAKQAAAFRISQQQTFAPDQSYRWLGSLAADRSGNILVVYNVSDAHRHPSLGFAGRLSTDPKGVLSKESILKEGKRSVDGDRWGDYGSVSLDSKDDCTFWVTGQYLSGDNPPATAAIASNSSEPLTAGVAGTGPVRVSPAKLVSSDVVSGYYWDTIVASIRFPGCH